ncbi:MAG: nitroreductase family protein [Thermoplasmata archaeon]
MMDVKEAIERRRAYRALKIVDIDEELVEELAGAARLSASCFNYQPWNYVFVYDEDTLEKMQEVMSSNNEWTRNASLIIAVFSKKDDDCVVKEREYFLFDTGMATALMILRATELGLVAHPIAGFDETKSKEILGIPDEYRLITLVIVGEHTEETTELMTDKQIEIEKERPERKELEEFVHHNTYK